jgi:hypothetical protein
MTMARIYYSAARGGFFHEAIHTALPEDAVRIPALHHARAGRAEQGRQIVADARGRCSPRFGCPAIEELRAQANRALAAEAERRILALASLARQSNDNALIAQAALARPKAHRPPRALPKRSPGAPPSTPCAPSPTASPADRHDARRQSDRLRRYSRAAVGRADMAKISQLPLVTEPDGSETFVVLKDGMAQRVPGAALIGAAGEVSLEQVQAAASAAQTSAQAAQASAQSAAQDASDARGEHRPPRRRPMPPPPPLLRSCCQAPAPT